MTQMQFNKRLEVDEYIGKSLDNILAFSSSIVAMPNFDLQMIQQKQRYLINQCENLCVGAGYINREKKKFNPSELQPAEKEFFDSACKYFKTKEEIFGINIERKAMDVLSEVVEGRYDAKVNRVKTLLEEKVVKKEITKFDADTQVDNFRLQLLIESIESKKPKKMEFGM